MRCRLIGTKSKSPPSCPSPRRVTASADACDITVRLDSKGILYKHRLRFLQRKKLKSDQPYRSDRSAAPGRVALSRLKLGSTCFTHVRDYLRRCGAHELDECYATIVDLVLAYSPLEFWYRTRA
jgi:hypothetical protein